MEIDAPEQAVAIWLEGDNIFCRFPDRQLVTFDNTLQLMNTLKHRERMARRRQRMAVGTNGAPVQYDIDKVAEALARKQTRAVDEKGTEVRERERARLLRKDAKMQAMKELRELNLL